VELADSEEALSAGDDEGEAAGVGDELADDDAGGAQHLARLRGDVGPIFEADADAADEREAVFAAQLEEVRARAQRASAPTRAGISAASVRCVHDSKPVAPTVVDVEGAQAERREAGGEARGGVG
jgi:hypothetical protein